jgi:hypothetical protein
MIRDEQVIRMLQEAAPVEFRTPIRKRVRQTKRKRRRKAWDKALRWRYVHFQPPETSGLSLPSRLDYRCHFFHLVR